ERTHGHYPAPLAALHAVQEGLEHGMAAGLAAETAAFGELATTPTARHLIWLFLATQRQKKRTGVGSARRIERLGVVGAGFMGAAIAELGAASGFSVRMRDVQHEMLARAMAGMRRSLSRRRGVKPAEVLARVSGTTDYTGFRHADLVIEAVFEQVDVKRRVIEELEHVILPEAVIASNTSALPIHELAVGATHPERIVGMHFFSPAQRMPLVEVIQPRGAAEWAVAAAVQAGRRMGKTVIVVADSPGFYTTRVLGVMLNEAALLLSEGARIQDVDRALVGFGFPVGPFVLYDEVGLEVAHHAGETVTEAFGDRLPASPIVPQLVAAGYTGRKARAGFYVWPQDVGRVRRFVHRPQRVEHPAVYRMLDAPPSRSFEPRFIQDRLVLLFVNEAIRCLEEGVLQSATDGDLGAVLGLGFPPFLGGPFHYADALGPGALRQKLEALAQQHGSRYAPSSLLVDRAREGAPFFSNSDKDNG
ncbi:MAG: fatty acid oxidation complex subunit alpha FadJ, partial [Chloroflexi bacterium]|nr:fatty acid oxidation complex subunit alpha FadJ [Chloroflexota bacterium]